MGEHNQKGGRVTQRRGLEEGEGRWGFRQQQGGGKGCLTFSVGMW
jgi:hypothetical protein